MFIQFIVKHYKVIFRSKLPDGFVFLLLFLAGLARYRAALVISVTGFLSAINQYYLDQGATAQITNYYDLLKRGFVPTILVALFFDINYGQIFPIYPALPVWLTVLSVVVGYAFSLTLYIKAGYLVQWISRDEIFVVCPNCSFRNIKIVEKCSNCGYTKDMFIERNVDRIPINEKISGELENEIALFKKMGMLKIVPQEVNRALKVEANEYILIAMKCPSMLYYGGVIKNGKRMRPGWFILTNKKIVSYYGWKGWTGIDFIPYQNIKTVSIVKDWLAYKKERYLEINVQNDSFRFLFGPTTKNLCKRIWLFEVDNKLTLEKIMSSINKRLSMGKDTLPPNKGVGEI